MDIRAGAMKQLGLPISAARPNRDRRLLLSLLCPCVSAGLETNHMLHLTMKLAERDWIL